MVLTRRARRFLGLLILLISLAFLLWGLWPLDNAIRTVPLEDLQLPTPVGSLPAFLVGGVFPAGACHVLAPYG